MKLTLMTLAFSASLGASAIAAPAMQFPVGYSEQQVSVPQSAITKRQAMMIAVQAAGGGRAISAHRDDFHDRPVWEVTVVNSPFQYEVVVDAGNGKVLRVRKHREDE